MGRDMKKFDDVKTMLRSKGEKLLIKYNEQNIGQNLKNCNPVFGNKSLKT